MMTKKGVVEYGITPPQDEASKTAEDTTSKEALQTLADSPQSRIAMTAKRCCGGCQCDQPK